MNTFKMAFRNVGRNKRRTLITTSAMTLAVAMMIVYTALFDGVLDQMQESVLVMDTGQVQIHKEGYRDDPSIYDTFEPDPILAKLDKSGLDATPRLFGFALAAAGSSSAGVQVRGVDIEREKTVTQLYQHVAQGQWLDANDTKGVVIGKRVAKSLGVGVGDEIVLLGQATDGSMANDLYKVRGILKTVGEALDRGGFLMSAAAFREFMVLDTGVHEIAVMGNLGDELPSLAQIVENASPRGLEVMTWRQLNPVVADLLDNSRGAMTFMILLTYTAVIMVVFNAMLMSVFERVREFGILKAIGLSPWSVAAIIAVEATIQATIAGIAAVAIGLPLALWLETHGLDFSSFAGDIDFAGMAMEPIWYPAVTANCVVQPLVFMFVLTLLAVAYPAGKAALIKPVEAFRQR